MFDHTEYMREKRANDPAYSARQKECSRAYRAANRERLNAASKAYYHANKETVSAKRRAKVRHEVLAKYGLTPEAYATLLDTQGGGCAICGVAEDQRGRSLPVDHDHATNAVRGILCSSCNLLIGYAGDSIERLQAAIAYLEEVGGS